MADEASKSSSAAAVREDDIRLFAERFRDFAAIGPQWFWEYDRDFRYVYMSERGLEMYCASWDEIIGKTREELVWAHLRPYDQEEWDRHNEAIRNRRPFRNLRYILERPNGEFAHVMTSGTPYFAQDGNFLGYRGVSIDVTVQANAEKRLRDAIESIEDGFAYFDADERFVLCNSKYLDFYPQAIKILEPGLAFEEIVRNGITKGYILSDAQGVEEYVVERMKKFRAAETTFDMQIADGRWLRVQDRRTPDGGTACFRIDITDFKRREDSLRREREVSDAANRAKTEFLSSMSHELRTPMNAILGFGQLIEQKGDQLAPEKIRDFAHHIVRSGQHLLALIGEVLDLSRIESGNLRFTIEDLDSHDLIGQCIEMVRGKANEAGITLIDDSDATIPMLATDAARFRQIMLNLLSNAVKYNRAGGVVTVRTRRQGADRVRISVSDTGEGIPEARREQIFQPFNRLGREEGDIEGTGIGLYLTQRLVEHLDGDIGFESSVGAGSTFWVDLPSAARMRDGVVSFDAAANAQPEHPARVSAGPCEVLYIEDNALHRVLMQEIFTDLDNMSLLIANDAETGIAMARARPPSLVLMDIDLPGMNGFEARRRLAASPETSAIPVVALTAGASDADVRRGLDGGFSDYLTKPIDIDRLLGSIERFTGTRALRRAEEPAAS